VTTRHGGAGAARELCDAVLAASGAYVNLLDRYGQ